MKFWFWDLESFGLNYGPILYQFFLWKLRKNVSAILPITSLFSVTFSWNLEGEFIFQTPMTPNVTKFTKCCQISHNFDLASTLSAFLINWHAIWQVVTFFRYKCHQIFFVDFIAKNTLLLLFFLSLGDINSFQTDI